MKAVLTKGGVIVKEAHDTAQLQVQSLFEAIECLQAKVSKVWELPGVSGGAFSKSLRYGSTLELTDVSCLDSKPPSSYLQGLLHPS